jgi:hypothetical protein
LKLNPTAVTVARIFETKNNRLDNDDEGTDPGSGQEFVIRKVMDRREVQAMVNDISAMEPAIAADVLRVVSARILANAVHVKDNAVSLFDDLAKKLGVPELSFIGPRNPPMGFG